MAALTISVSWSTLIADYAPLFVVSCLLVAAFTVLIAGVMMTLVLRRHLATIQSVFGAVCVYLLLGLSWAELYWATVRVDAAALYIPPRIVATQSETVEGDDSIPAFSDMVYFSFVTMSTLGYGDIRPQAPAVKTLAWMQAVLGQFYLAVLVAWIVNSIRLWTTEPAEDPEANSS